MKSYKALFAAVGIVVAISVLVVWVYAQTPISPKPYTIQTLRVDYNEDGSESLRVVDTLAEGDGVRYEEVFDSKLGTIERTIYDAKLGVRTSASPFAGIWAERHMTDRQRARIGVFYRRVHSKAKDNPKIKTTDLGEVEHPQTGETAHKVQLNYTDGTGRSSVNLFSVKHNLAVLDREQRIEGRLVTKVSTVSIKEEYPAVNAASITTGLQKVESEDVYKTMLEAALRKIAGVPAIKVGSSTTCKRKSLPSQ